MLSFRRVVSTLSIALFAVGIALHFNGPRVCLAESDPIQGVSCPGKFKKHLQGVCADPDGNFYWSFTTEFVKTDRNGKLLKQVQVADHHGDLCYQQNCIFVAVNLGKFNQPAGRADSWVYVYDPESLVELKRYPVSEVVHGAGGIGFHNGKFLVVGGLPKGTPENYLYEYDPDFRFIKRHVLKSGETHLGIQTVTYHAGSWWFGCYGEPKVLLKASPDFQFSGRSNFDCSFGLIGIDETHFLVARGGRSPDGLNTGKLVPARITSDGSLTLKVND